MGLLAQPGKKRKKNRKMWPRAAVENVRARAAARHRSVVIAPRLTQGGMALPTLRGAIARSH
jgi:hypothetical protein